MMKRTPSVDGAEVSFVLPIAECPDGASVVGDFNGWDPEAHPLRRRSNGTRSVKLRLEPGCYRFKYLLHGGEWRNEDDADRHESNEWGQLDSVLDIG